jgi:hypothetical protein
MACDRKASAVKRLQASVAAVAAEVFWDKDGVAHVVSLAETGESVPSRVTLFRFEPTPGPVIKHPAKLALDRRSLQRFRFRQPTGLKQRLDHPVFVGLDVVDRQPSPTPSARLASPGSGAGWRADEHGRSFGR